MNTIRSGDLLLGKYRVERELGSGGMGVVVAARHEQLDQLVAIKFVRDEALASDEAVQRFVREARAAAKLKSEHAAKVLDVGTLPSGTPYMVMEFLDGRDLSATLVAGGPAAPQQAADWVLQACEAVAEAHAAGIVHRDLKPQNLFLTRTIGGVSKIKVLDFGVSKSTQFGEERALTGTRSMLGSPLYMSPEQMRSSRNVDARTDVWALGVVLFELMTQRWPFEADSMPDLCLKVVQDPPQSLAQLRPDVPKALVALVERCLQKDPAKRFANAAELASALEAFVPPAARAPAERARLAMMSDSSASQPGMAVDAGRGSSPGRPSGAATGPTPVSWDSHALGRTTTHPKRRRVLLTAGIAGVAVIAAAAAFVVRGRPTEAPSAASGVEAATAAKTTAPPSTVTAAERSELPPLSEVLEAPATASAGPAASAPNPARSPGAPSAASSVTATPPRGVSTKVTGSPPPRASGRASHTDDDIPALR